jgi:hypothetical protein
MDKETREQLEQIIETALIKALEPFKNDLRAIERYLYNDENTNKPGIVQQVEDHEKRLKEIETEKRIDKRLWAVAYSVMGAAVMVIIEFLRWYFKNH